MAALDRSYWLAVGAVAYVGVANAASSPITALRATLLGVAPFALAWVFRHTESPSHASTRPALRAARAVVTGGLVWLLSRTGDPNAPALAIAGVVGAGVCNVAALYGLARLPSRAGLIEPPRIARSLDAAAFAATLWGGALVCAFLRSVAPGSRLQLDPLTLDYANTAAGIGGLLVLIAAAWRLRVARKLELGTSDRALGALVLSISALAVAVPAAAANLAAPDLALSAAGIVAALVSAWAAVAKDPSHVSSALRVAAATLTLAVPVALITGTVVNQAEQGAGLIALAGCAFATCMGLLAQKLATPLRPVQSRWLTAVTTASERALTPEPNAAIIATLTTLRTAFGSAGAAPQLWRLTPPATLSVDVAGYLSEHREDIPLGLAELALGEPEHTLRVETLKALEVRRPALRPLLTWFEARGAFCATAITDEDGPLGFLLMPRAGRRTLLSLEEARQLRLLCERLSALLSVTSSLARARQRELEATKGAASLLREYEKTRDALADQRARNRGFAENLARPLIAAAYSASTRLTIARLKEVVRQGDPVALQVPLGVEPLAWVSVLHLAGPFADGPFVHYDGRATQPEANQEAEQVRTAWNLATGGTLFVQDLHLLREAAQHVLLELLTAPPSQQSGAVGVQLAVSIHVDTSDLVAASVLVPAFARIFGTRYVALPTLLERAEDLRSLVLENLSRSAQGPEHGPLGIERGALAELLDHDWPGNDRELSDLLGRASQLETGPRLTLTTLARAGFSLRLSEARALPPGEVVVPVETSSHQSTQAPPVRRKRPQAPRGRRPR